MKKLLLLLLFPLQIFAQNIPFSAFKNYPFPTELTASAQGQKIAWALNEQGKRNVYVAEGPAFIPKKITDFTKDDGQEITSLQISDDGKWVVFVRGGDHGANWDDDLPVNPAASIQPFKVQIASVPFTGGAVKYLSEGDEPIITPDNNSVTFIKSGQAWSAPIDGSSAAKNLFTTRGTVSSLQWSDDGKRLLFVSSRPDHSIIGFYTNGSGNLKWIAPSFNRDNSPQWSTDGSRIVFIRRLGLGGSPDSLLVKKHLDWSICMADTLTNTTKILWKSPNTLRGNMPTTDGGANLHWAENNTITFLSYQDGWPHLYSVNANGGPATLLTPGNYMCEHIKLSSDKKYLTFSANTGADKLDVDRRHVLKVSVSKPEIQVFTPGDGLEWSPVITGDGNAVAFFSATAQRPPLPAVMPINEPLSTKEANGIKLLAQDLISTEFPQSKLVTPKQIIFQSPDGVTIHAQLFEPNNGAGKKPAIVYVHGGPPRQMLLGWNYSDYYANAYASNQYLASLGFVVLSVNYRLGIGYGYEFHQPKNGGITGASEYQDIKAAGEWLQKQSFVDVKKIGIYGGSYGGYLTAMALAKDSKLFAAGVDIHGVHNWEVNSSLAATANNFEKAPDYEKARKTAWASSPVAYINTWTSPVLIIQGDDDRNVRVSQSVDLISRLEKQHVPYETKMIVDDTHHWMKFENAVTVYKAVADYFIGKFMK